MNECCASGSCEVCSRPSGYTQDYQDEIRDYETPWVRRHREEGWRHHRAGDQPITTDDFTAAARAEGQARIAAMLEMLGTSDDIRAWFPAGFEKGAEWARAHLAAQEPTDAGPHELDESAPIRNLGYYRSSARCKCGYEVIWGMNDGDAGQGEAWRVHLMRSDVHATRAARRDEEKR